MDASWCMCIGSAVSSDSPSHPIHLSFLSPNGRRKCSTYSSLCRNMNVISCTKVTLLFNLSNMFTIILLMAVGALTGHLLRHIRLLRQVEKSASLTVFALLFVLGLSIGSNQLIIENLDRFGWQAAVLATAGTAGSILAAALVVQLFFNKKKEKKA